MRFFFISLAVCCHTTRNGKSTALFSKITGAMESYYPHLCDQPSKIMCPSFWGQGDTSFCFFSVPIYVALLIIVCYIARNKLNGRAACECMHMRSNCIFTSTQLHKEARWRLSYLTTLLIPYPWTRGFWPTSLEDTSRATGSCDLDWKIRLHLIQS